jgi:hypothetical protein
MNKKIKLFNYYHNGDIFYSRMLVQFLLRNNYEIEYYHNLNTPLLNDYDNLTEIKGIPSEWVHTLDIKDSYPNGILNTWIAQGDARFFNQPPYPFACCYENHFSIVKEINKLLNLDLGDDEVILPKITFDKLENYQIIKTKMEEFKEKYEKVILISNGNVHSGQADNFDFTSIIESLSYLFPKYLFITTQKINTPQQNIIDSFDITTSYPDLIYIGFISTYCDVVVGRNSGPYCYTMIENNIMDENKIYICFCRDEYEGKFYQNSKFKFYWSNNFEIENVEEYIKTKI